MTPLIRLSVVLALGGCGIITATAETPDRAATPPLAAGDFVNTRAAAVNPAAPARAGRTQAVPNPRRVAQPASRQPRRRGGQPRRAAAEVPAPVISPAQPIESLVEAEPEVDGPPLLAAPTTPEEPARPSVRRPSPLPASAFEVRAPSTSRRPSPIPSFEEPGLTLTDGLRTVDLGTGEGGFQPPDWTQPLENLQAEDRLILRSDLYEAMGNVRLQLEDTLFRSEYFRYLPETGEAFAEGDVRVTQGLSILEADSLNYVVTPSEEMPRLSPFADEQLVERRRLTIGRVTAENLYLLEPTREISADHVDYDFLTESGEFINPRGRAGVFYFGADRLHVLGPQDAAAEDIWVTTCDLPTPHYRIRLRKAAVREGAEFSGADARLQLGKIDTPLYWPRWRVGIGPGAGLGFEFDSGRTAELGYFVNIAQWFPVTPNAAIGLRLFPTEKEGVGFGLDAEYDYLQNPESRLFRARGAVESLYSTEERGFLHWYNRYDIFDDTVMLNQIELWSDRTAFKDYYYDRFRNRTEPRTFTNLTRTRPAYIASATARVSTNNWVRETERLPEVTFHLLERPLLERLYVTYDTIVGYNERNPAGTHAARFVNVGRLTLDLDLHEAFSITPFVESELTWYSDRRDGDSAITRFSTLAGVTAQSRFHRTFAGRWGFSEFKHILVPSVTLSYRPAPTVAIDQTPRFDAYDNVYGRTRIESKIDNVVLGRDAETHEVWQVARLTLYQGHDLWNEFRKAEDYEFELDIRPRPWWGFQGAAESHNIQRDYDLDRPFFVQRLLLEMYESLAGRPWDPEAAYQFNAQYGDYNRILAFLYYDGTPLGRHYNGRIGYAYTSTQGNVFNRELLYGVGYRLNENWAVAFEHRYDFERDQLTRQTYELRRALHCWEMALKFRDRESGWDVGVEFNIRAFPGSRVRF
jgi:hypothetical protein